MSMIVLPRTGEPNAAAEAERKLISAIEDPLTVVMLVFGDDAEVARVLEVCTARASVKAAIRRVVWIPDPSVLPDTLSSRFARSGRVAVAVGLKDTVVASLTLSKAKQRIFVEEAFLTAEDAGT